MSETGTSETSMPKMPYWFVPLNLTPAQNKDLEKIRKYQEEQTGIKPPISSLVRGGIELYKRHYESCPNPPLVVDTDHKKNCVIALSLPGEVRFFLDDVIRKQTWPPLSRHVLLRCIVAYTINVYFERMEADADKT